ncbi:MAG TPA: hypothetical protein VFE02_15920 [Candidatus Acidoferrales bacterium]|jgi:hypothetical protein|nr:hypothetical protein [Candidatus Acidoferrales bacterium]
MPERHISYPAALTGFIFIGWGSTRIFSCSPEDITRSTGSSYTAKLLWRAVVQADFSM